MSHPANLENILEVVLPEIESLEVKILEDIQTDIPLLTNVSDHILNSGGKRLRPAMVLLGAKMFAGVNDQVVEAAQVIEYLHTATLLHDDVVDGAETRRSKKAACRIWGNEASILTGDYMLSMAFHRLTKLRHLEVLKLMSETTTRMARGELLQLTRSLETAIEEEYLEIIINKTACLFGAATKMGALLAGASVKQAELLYDYGINVGIAFQIVDDALDYSDEKKTGKPVGGDLQERKITLPLGHLLENASLQDAQKIKQFLDSPEINKTDIDAVIDMMNQYGSVDYSLTCAKVYVETAKSKLQEFPDSELKNSLQQLADFIVARQL